MPSIRARFNDTRFNDFFVRSLSAQHSWKDSRGHGIVAELIKSVESKYRQFIVFLLDFQSLDVSKLDGFEVYHFEVCIFHGSIVQPLRKLLRSMCVTLYFIGIERKKAESTAIASTLHSSYHGNWEWDLLLFLLRTKNEKHHVSIDRWMERIGKFTTIFVEFSLIFRNKANMLLEWRWWCTPHCVETFSPAELPL